MKNSDFKSSPISATPILKGQDLVDLVKDLDKPDLGKDRRQEALKILKKIRKRGQQSVGRERLRGLIDLLNDSQVELIHSLVQSLLNKKE